MDGPGGAKARMAAAPGPCVPDDAIVEMFKFLPAKSLHRFKGVSKAWRAMVTDPLHRRLFAQTLAGFLHLHAAQIGGAAAESDSDSGVCERCRDGGESSGSLRTCRHVLLWTRRFINVSGMAEPLIDPAFSFLPPAPAPLDGEEHRDVILDSSDGLILLGRFRMDGTPGLHLPICYLVCNPTTARSAIVPPDSGWAPDHNPEMVLTYLLFDAAASLHRFHLVQFWVDEMDTVRAVHTYSSADGAWTNRVVEWFDAGWRDWGRDMALIQPGTGSAVVNGMLHLVVDTDGTDGPNNLVVVDETGRTPRTIPLPRDVEEKDWYSVFVARSQGRLHYIMCVRPPHGGLSPEEPLKLLIWVLEDYGTGEWALKHTVSFPELFGRIACQFRAEYNVVALHPDGNRVFFTRHRDRKLVAYDMDHREVHVVGDLGPGAGGDQCGDDLPTPYIPLYSKSSALASSESERKPVL